MTLVPDPSFPAAARSMEDEIGGLLDGNRRWAEARQAEDPNVFHDLAQVHRPPFLLVGCCDARKPLNVILQASPGQLFIHRNVGNQVRSDDPAIEASVEFAIQVLGVRHLIVCGHTGCGAMQAALEEEVSPAVRRWVEPVRALAQEKAEILQEVSDLAARADLLAEFNVLRQARNLLALSPVREAIVDPGRDLALHAWFFRLKTGRIEPLTLPVDRWLTEGWWPE